MRLPALSWPLLTIAAYCTCVLCSVPAGDACAEIHFRTAEQPSAAVLHRTALLARAAARSLQRLVEGVPSAGAAAAAAAVTAPPAQWLSLFCTPLHDFDALVVLRPEALPLAVQALPAMTAQLEGLLAAAGCGGKKRKKGGANTAAAAAAAAAAPLPPPPPHVLTQLVVSAEGPPPKRCRAILRAFPDSVVATQGLAKLRRELLVGFDPLALFLRKCAERFGHLGTFCADAHGGRVVAVKWDPAAFAPAPLQVATAHTSLPCQFTAGAGGAASLQQQQAVMAVPNVVQVLHEMAAIGEGLTAQVLLLGR